MGEKGRDGVRKTYPSGNQYLSFPVTKVGRWGFGRILAAKSRRWELADSEKAHPTSN